MKIREIFDEALSSPPCNESTTCEWVLYPILQEIGYSKREIMSRIADSNGQFPDYTLLPETSHTWYLEAKDWNVLLQDKFAQQSLNYANQNGRRWVVLTNGQVWRLYDNDIRGIAEDKLVTVAKIQSPDDAHAFVQAISKNSIVSGGLERYASNVRLASALGAQLCDPNSEVVKALWGVVRKMPGLHAITKQSIAGFFSPDDRARSESRPTEESATAPEASETFCAVAVPDTGGYVTLRDMAVDPRKYATGKQPEFLLFQDSVPIRVQRWKGLMAESVRLIVESAGSVSIPYQQPRARKRYVVNKAPQHPKGVQMLAPAEISTKQGTLFVETHLSAASTLDALQGMCEAWGVSATDLRIRCQDAE